VGPAPGGGHRTALMNLGGKHYLAQRYALDFGKVDAEGRLLRKGGVSTNNADYPAFGERVYAVADGTIAGVRDGIADNHGVTRNPEVANTIDTILGNYVMLQVSSSAFAVYAHLRRGSVRFAAGQTVKKGDLVGEVGNSGHARGPHLHMHVCDAPSDLRCEGLPFVFESYEARTYEPLGESIETARFQGSSTAVMRQRQLPAAERMLAF
jgi:peptidase M23-like protein